MISIASYKLICRIIAVLGWGRDDKIRLTDVTVVTLHPGKMTNSRRTHPVPQLKCVGGTAGCSAVTPIVVQCYNRGSDGYDVQVIIDLEIARGPGEQQ